MRCHLRMFGIYSIVAATLLVTGCGRGESWIGGRNTVSVGQTPTDAQNGTTNGTTNGAGVSTAQNSISTGNSAAPMTDEETLVVASLQAATVGRVSGIPYAVDTTNFEDVQRKMGRPATQSQAGAGIYATYAKPNVAFGFNKGEQIFDVRSYDKTFQAISMNEVESVLGQPGAVREHGDETIWLYTAGPKFQLLWVFPKATTLNPNPHVDHISVFCPQDTVNSMAQNQPAPTVRVQEAPGHSGDFFTFAIEQAPIGYSLAELEFVPTHGQAVVNTFDEAARYGKTGSVVPSFAVHGNAGTFQFDYPSAMVGLAGQVVVIYQNVEGSAMIGQSDTIVLK